MFELNDVQEFSVYSMKWNDHGNLTHTGCINKMNKKVRYMKKKPGSCITRCYFCLLFFIPF
uniref:Uncharacterized protein n=1 Tax=Anguilla anguilla TaxID=7936 RepID=A0A0E9WFF4_ANGAN